MDVLEPLAQAGVGYVQQQMQLKQASKLAKLQTQLSSQRFPTLGTGNMAFGTDMTVFGVGNTVNTPIDYGAGVTSGGSSTATMRRSSIVQGPDGRLYRSIGRPLLWSGDLAAFKRVRKIAGKLRSYAGHRSFR
jgi:hypothetical protein